MEIALIGFLDIRKNIIVNNVSWGLFNHECDLVSVSKAGYATEIEIKISRGDLIADKKKKHAHNNDNRLKYLYFAIPSKLLKDIEHIPKHAGIIEVFDMNGRNKCRYIREAKKRPTCTKLTDKEITQLYRLGCMRIEGFMIKVSNLKKEIKKLKKGNAKEYYKCATCDEMLPLEY
jgi:hypothetical protein